MFVIGDSLSAGLGASKWLSGIARKDAAADFVGTRDDTMDSEAGARVLRERPSGALTPAQAFGADFVLNIEGVRRSTAAPLAHPIEENQQ